MPPLHLLAASALSQPVSVAGGTQRQDRIYFLLKSFVDLLLTGDELLWCTYPIKNTRLSLLVSTHLFI